MNIDDIKNSYQSLAYSSDSTASIDFTRKVEGIVEKVRKEDRRDKMILVVGGILLGVFAVIYAIQGVVAYIEKPGGTMWWGDGFYVLAILTVLPVFRYKYKKIGASRYDAPVAQFIEEVEKKFAFFPKEYAILIIPFVVLADASMIYIFAENGRPTLHGSLLAQIPLIVGLGVGLAIAAVLWYTKKLPILEELRAIKSNLS
jgi:phosphoglycerol transferase MdoB-like AlkP superfamily enzyme